MHNNNNRNETNKKSNTVFYKIQFTICIFIVICFSFYYIYHLYDKNKKENISKKLADNFSITNLYNTSYSANRLSNTYETDKNKFDIVGLIEINSININYPIISNVSIELLKIAPCRFFGPMPNKIGNMCIAGHNYNSYKFFSKLKDLKIGDKINIYDLYGKKITYSVYDSYEIDYTDLSPLNQDTNGKREITLITCNNIKNRRRVIKATE